MLTAEPLQQRAVQWCLEEVTGKEGAFLEDVPVALLRTLRESFEGELGDADVSVLEDVEAGDISAD